VSRGHEGHRQAVRRPLPVAPLRPRRLRRDRDARGRARHPDRGDGCGRDDAGAVQESAPREGVQSPVLPHHGEHARVRSARGGRVLPREVPHPRAPARLLRRRAGSGALLAQPRDGGVRAHPAHGAGRALRHAPQAPQRVVRIGMRALVTGLSTYWGGRLAQALEQRTDVEVVVGVDTRDPRMPLDRTEFVRTDSSHSILARIVRATQVDTIVHTHLVVDSTRATSRTLHEINVIGTMNLLAAAGAPGSPVRKVVLKSSGLVYGANKSDPYNFREDMSRTSPATTPVERSLL